MTLLIVEAALAVAFGVVRAATVRVWRDETGAAWSRATGWTLVGWLASLATRVALLGVGPALGLDLAFAPTALLFFVGLTIGAQSLFVARRARALPLSPPRHPGRLVIASQVPAPVRPRPLTAVVHRSPDPGVAVRRAARSGRPPAFSVSF
ncbi:hypothetical protein ACFQX6_20735 [Streptosporangium lutulentum]